MPQSDTLANIRPRRHLTVLALAGALSVVAVGAMPAQAEAVTRYRVTISVPAQSPLVDVPFEISGTVSPTADGENVRLQELLGGEFKTVAITALDASSAYEFTEVFDHVGGHTFRVVKPAQHHLLQGTSPEARVFVTGDTITSSRAMRGGESLISSAGSFRFTMGLDGNITITIVSTRRTIWSSHTAGHPGAWVILLRDGDLVLHAANGSILKDFGSGGHPAGTYHMTMQENSNLVIYTPKAEPVWSSDTTNPALGSTEVLKPGQFLRSANHRYQLLMQTDGNLVLRNAVHGWTLWESNTATPRSTLTMQDDGNVVVRGPYRLLLWSSRTPGHPGASGLLQNDGNFMVSLNGHPIWGTRGVNGVLGDDYPTDLRNADRDSIIDPWRFYNRECVSFVAWRLNNANRMEFSNFMDGGHFGNANNWDDNARALGYTVDKIPVRGAVAQSDAQSGYGHVAWVAAVGDGTVTIEDYNYSAPGTYGFRTVPTSTYVYIHLKDLAH